jgi:hypothetical protein
MTENERNELKKNIKELATTESMTELETISYLQTAAAMTDNEELLDMLCEIKWDYIS